MLEVDGRGRIVFQADEDLVFMYFGGASLGKSFFLLRH
jgi:hypothetical protein